jgi:hypothetical protein
MSRPPGAALRRAVIDGAVRVARIVLRRPQVKYMARQLLAHFPALRTRIRNALQRHAMSSKARLSNRVQDDADLSPRTVRMLRALKQAAARNQRP